MFRNRNPIPKQAHNTYFKQMIFTEDTIYELNGLKQNLPGFDEKYVNIVDYILKITEEIWEERAVWVIYETYSDDIPIHVGARTIQGIESVVLGTIKTLSSFPDRKMGGEAVIWSKIDKNHFYSSHRIASTATNLGATDYGAATGKKVFFRTIADCLVTENKIVEEWLVRDNLYLIQQLGFDPVEMAKKDQRYSDQIISFSANGQHQPSKNGQVRSLDLSEPSDLIISLFEDIWKTRKFEDLDQYYHILSIVNAVCDNYLVGPRQLKVFLKKLFASFPEAEVQLERVSSNQKGDEVEVAARWKIIGQHTGDGFFSPASGKNIIMPGISHYIIKNGKIIEEWMVFDGFDVLCQIYADVKPTIQPALNGQASSNGILDKKMQNKAMVLTLINEVNTTIANKKDSTKLFKKYFSKNICLNITKPYEEIKGIKGYANDFWLPLLESFPDMEDQPYILIGGNYEGRDYVSWTGNFIGTFEKAWHDIPPTQQPTWLRYAAHALIEKGKIVKFWYFFDMLDVMRQAGFNFFPNRGLEIVPPAPMTGDGIVDYSTTKEAGQKTLDLTNAMLNGLGDYDGKTLDSMGQERFWDVKNMMWYGPSGIGTTRGLKGFQDNHQVPFLVAFPDRGITPKKGKDYFAQIGDGNYSCDFGFPAMYGTHKGDDWLGLTATGKTITLRVVDYWRREGERLKENWVFIDMVDVLEQLGIDVFEMLKNAVNQS